MWTMTLTMARTTSERRSKPRINYNAQNAETPDALLYDTTIVQ